MTNKEKAKRQRDRRKTYSLSKRKKIAKQVKAYAEANKERLSFLKAEMYRINREYILHFKATHPCVICGQTDPFVLDFDHLDPSKKEATVANMLGRTASLEKIKKEIAKCQILCANCHRRKHFYEKNKYNFKQNIVLIGGGNHVQYCIDIIKKQNKYNIVGIIDSVKDIGEIVYDYPVIGRQKNIVELSKQYGFESGIITVGDNWARYKIYGDIIEAYPSFMFVNAIHPSVLIGNNVKIGKGVIAMAGVIFNPGANIGDFTFFATGAQVEHDCIIEHFASVSAGSILGGHVHIKEFAAITLGVTIIDRLTIGWNTVIGSGSLVTKDIDDNVLAYGSPAKVIRIRQQGERFLK
jgi:sugar O-acyltransferase (sialic acid O-acetyltransferase NeuD family)